MRSSLFNLLEQYEDGQITRRELVGALMALLALGSPGAAADYATRNIDHVSVAASDPSRSAEFYRNVFGLDVGRAAPDGSIRLTIEGKLRLTLRADTKPGIIDHFAFGVAPFDQNVIAKTLADKGINTYTEPIAFGFHVRDPDGVPVQLSRAG
jgi:catechol 2,3-dioxygenase-like lactoylglutathione lyase family enzyme